MPRTRISRSSPGYGECQVRVLELKLRPRSEEYKIGSQAILTATPTSSTPPPSPSPSSAPFRSLSTTFLILIQEKISRCSPPPPSFSSPPRPPPSATFTCVFAMVRVCGRPMLNFARRSSPDDLPGRVHQLGRWPAGHHLLGGRRPVAHPQGPRPLQGLCLRRQPDPAGMCFHFCCLEG